MKARLSLKSFLILIMGMLGLMGAASATIVNSLEGGSTLADNGLTLTQGIASRATIQPLVTSDGTTLDSTHGGHLLKLIAGTETDIINPAFPTQLVTLVTSNNPVVIDKHLFLIDIAFMNRGSAPRNDRLLIGLNGLLYDVTGSVEAGYHDPFTLGWQTLAIYFADLGSVSFSIGCLNDTFNTGSSYCVSDYWRTADVLPTQAENGGIPVFSSTNIPDNIIAPPPPVTQIPEPGSLALLLAAMAAFGVISEANHRRRVRR